MMAPDLLETGEAQKERPKSVKTQVEVISDLSPKLVPLRS